MEALGTLVSGVAHEISNPINLILYNMPLLKKVRHDFLPVIDGPAHENPDKRYGGLSVEFLEQNLLRLLNDIEMAAGRVAKIVTDLKNFARRPASTAMQPISVNEAVENAARLVSSTLSSAGVRIEKRLGEKLPAINGNLQNIEQVIINILVNAVQAIDHPRGRILIETAIRASDGRLHLSISDNGRGVDPKLADRLFDPFVTDKQIEGGTGLGLSVSYSLVKHHDGHISFENRPEGGTVFDIAFPTLAAGKAAKILIVDDDPSLRRLLTRTLMSSRHGYHLEQAANGIEACLKLGTFRPDLLILDIFMPGMDGAEVCAALKKDPALSDLKVIVTTGHPQHPKLGEIRRLGFDTICPKPFDMSELIEFIDNILTS
jgi:CheY-like chemotaxis protein